MFQGRKGTAILGVIGSIAGGLALLIASQLFSGVNKAQADISELKAKEIVDIEALKKDSIATRAGIETLLDLQGKNRPEVIKYRVLYPNTTSTKNANN